jgi:peptide/nickel transport system ATP-binding protein
MDAMNDIGTELNGADSAAPAEVSATPLLEVQGLTVELHSARGRLRVLSDVTLTVAPGEVVALVGESGSGKSMTANSVLGLLPPMAEVVSGQILLNGSAIGQVTQRKLREIRGRRIGMILQDPLASLNPVHRVGRQVAEPLRAHDIMGRQPAISRAVELLDHVGIADASRRSRDYPHQFSGGMRQRIVGAAAVICSPELLIADEPTTALDVTAQAAYLDLLERLQEESSAGMLFITHDLNVVRRMADRVVVMYGGRVMEIAPLKQIFTAPRHPYTMGLLNCLPGGVGAAKELVSIDGGPPDPAALPAGCPFAPRCPAHVEACDDAPPPLLEFAPGHQVACVRAGDTLTTESLWASQRQGTAAPRSSASSPTSEAQGPGVTLALDQAVMEFGRARSRGGLVRAVDGISLSVRSGASVSIVGESGSGKTTCAKLLLGLERPTAGRATFNGSDVSRLKRGEDRLYRRSVQAVFQDPFSSLNPRMTIDRIVAEPLAELSERGNGTAERRERVEQALRSVGLQPSIVAAAYPHQLSGGQRQRVAIARAMAVNPEILILDEPVSALDVSVRAQVMNLLRDIRAAQGTGYVTISHDLPSVRYLSSEIVVMYRGSVVEIGETDQLFSEPRHPYTRQLLHDALLDRPGERFARSQNPATEAQQQRAQSQGCKYFSTCPIRMDVCAEQRPGLLPIDGVSSVACHAVTTPI